METTLTTPILCWQHIHVQVRAQTLLTDINAQVPARGLLGIVGGNGAGKSTLLRAALGLVSVTAGQVALCGRPITDWSLRDRAARLGYVPQNTQAHWDLTVRELLSLQTVQWPATLLGDCALEPLLDRHMHTLSGGERARAWLARALVHQPALLLADEPGAHLDIPHHHHLMQLLKAQARARAVVVVLHDLHIASRYCDHLLLLSHGHLLASGSPDQVLSETLLSTAFGADIVKRQAGDWQVFGSARAS